MFDINTVRLINKKSDKPSKDEVSALRKLLNVQLPQYEEFVLKLGDGCLSDAVRVYSPERIFAELDQFRERWKEYFLWDGAGSELEKGFEISAVPIADSLQGDEIVQFGEGLYILPRYSNVAKLVAKDLFGGIEYICESGEVFDDVDDYYFESYKNRGRLKFINSEFTSFERVINIANSFEYVHRRDSIEDEFLSLEIPSIEGTISFFSDEAAVVYDLDYNTTSIVETLKRNGYSIVD